MMEHCDRPIIFALSNPTSNSECSAEQAYEWTKGKCIFASGSPFDPVEAEGKKHPISQANNVYIFPGLGLGASLCNAKKVTQGMLSASAEGLAELVSKKDIEEGIIYPNLADIRNISAHIASRVMQQAHREGVATNTKIMGMEEGAEVEKFVKEQQYIPEYRHDSLQAY